MIIPLKPQSIFQLLSGVHSSMLVQCSWLKTLIGDFEMVCVVTYYLRLVDEIANLDLQWIFAVRANYAVCSCEMPTVCFEPVWHGSCLWWIPCDQTATLTQV